ncbi:MAG: (d)CMP kinase [Elusimicrobiota bacterium]
MRLKGLVIAMDGPAGVGKSTVGGLVAKRLGYKFINTGEMYRALTWKALEEGVDLNDHDAVLALAKSLRWEFKPVEEGGTTLKTFIAGIGVTHQIRDERVSVNSSLVAANSGVRKFLSKLQRGLGERGAIVMEGRDITTNVFPDADVKIYLDASPEERADRRYRQLKAAGQEADRAAILAAILKRDLNDLKREINPLKQAPDALVIDSTRMTLHQVAEKILRRIRHGRGQASSDRGKGKRIMRALKSR